MQGVAGLRPTTWLAVGSGYSREDVKELFLSRGESLVADAVTNAQELSEKIIAATEGKKPQVLEAVARQEALRMLLSEPRISSSMVELKRLRRQGGFFRRLDQAIQAGRLAAAHAQETEVFCERLEARFGASPLRDELRRLAFAFETWMGATNLLDPVMAFAMATDILQTQGWPERLSRPEKILHLSVQEPEGLEKSFWDALISHVSVERMSAMAELRAPEWLGWERWHTLDDACEGLAQKLSAEFQKDPSVLEKHAVLIADSLTLRRSLKRSLAQWKIPEADPRDPNRLKWDESLKEALAPLDVISGNFERTRVTAFLKAEAAHGKIERAQLDEFIKEMNERGIRQGLSAYAGGKLVLLHARLESLREFFGGRKTLAEISAAHLAWIRERAIDGDWRVPFFEALWKAFAEDYERLELTDRSAALLYWVERLQERIEQAPAPIERLKPRGGLRVYRLQQALPLGLEKIENLWILGMPSQWFSAEGVGDYWYSEREREVLAAEFAVRSGIQVRAERLNGLRGWLARADQARFIDAQYDSDGRERESITTALREVGFEFGSEPGQVPLKPEEKGAHARWLPSFGAMRPLPPQEVKLAPLPRSADGGKPELNATTLDHYSRCAFQGLAMDRWQLRDVREPEPELWPDVRGTLLHAAVKELLKTRTPEGQFTLTSTEAIERAWGARPPRGMIRSRRVENYVRRRLVQVLDEFKVQEDKYFTRARAEVVSLDERSFRLELSSCFVKGQPDRIDRATGGLFLMDYKSSGTVPNGMEMVELGYRLQLPFYALAASREMQAPVLGVQFIELKNPASRTSGVFFEAYNGKEPGKLTELRKNSKSLLKMSPEDVWSTLHAHLDAHASGYVEGRFAARPKKESKECDRCVISDLCGYRRKVSDGLAGEEGASDE